MEHSETGRDAVDIQMVLDQIGGDRTLLREVIRVFLTDGPDIRNRLRQAFEQQDVQQLREAAHSAKGAVGNFCTEEAVRAAISLENACKNGDLEHLQEQTHALLIRITNVENALREALDTL